MIEALSGLVVICLMGVAFTIFLEWRNNLVFRIRCEARGICKARGTALILEGKPWRPAWYPFEKGPGYYRMIFMFRHRTLSDFYPDLVGLELER